MLLTLALATPRARARRPTVVCALDGPPLALDDLKAELLAEARGAADPDKLRAACAILEAHAPDDRPAGSPLLDGRWETVWSSGPPRWRGPLTGRLTHVVEGGWLGEERSRYWQRCARLGCSLELHARFTTLGGDHWELEYDNFVLSLLGVPVWRRRVRRRDSADLDWGIRPTYLDGEVCIMRTPAVLADTVELRAERIYLMRRLRHRLNNDMRPAGSPDGFVKGPKWLDVD